MARPEQVIEEFVRAFVAAWPSRDSATVAAFFADGASYQNGLLNDDRMVMTERVDHFFRGDKRYSRAF